MKLGIELWDKDKSYKVGDLVVFINAVFMCRKANSAILPIYDSNMRDLMDIYYPGESEDQHVDNESWVLI